MSIFQRAKTRPWLLTNARIGTDQEGNRVGERKFGRMVPPSWTQSALEAAALAAMVARRL
jgi:hypothetical protein